MSSLARDVTFWVAVACCAVGSLAILRLTLAPQRPGAVGASQSHRLPRSSRAIEITWVVMPMVALAGLLYWTRLEMQRRAPQGAGRAPALGAVHERTQPPADQ